MNLTQIHNINDLLKIAQQHYKIYVDQDGVLSDFDKAFESFGKGTPDEFVNKHSEETMWYLINNNDPHFFLNLEWMPNGKQLWNFLKPYNPTILTKPAKMKYCIQDKKKWIKENIGDVPIIISTKKEKYADENSILIDDREENIIPWKEAGGLGILHKSTNDTIKQLQKLL